MSLHTGRSGIVTPGLPGLFSKTKSLNIPYYDVTGTYIYNRSVITTIDHIWFVRHGSSSRPVRARYHFWEQKGRKNGDKHGRKR